RQLERWRQKGAIPETDREWGGGGGSDSAYPDGTADQVIELVGLLDRYRDLDTAILCLFARGQPVSEEGLKRAFGSFLADAQASLVRPASEADPRLDLESAPDELADAVGGPLAKRVTKARVGRFMARNVKRMPDRVESVSSVLTSVISNSTM